MPGNAIDRFMADETLITGSISTVATADQPLVSDRITIRNAVTSAAIGDIPSEGLGWANAETGSRGVIRQIEETRDEGRLCRSFIATRESFAGAHLYRGRACLRPALPWAMLAFDRVE